jgi:hypothetical protein
MPLALRPVPYALRPLPCTLCLTPCAFHLEILALCLVPLALCHTPCAFRLEIYTLYLELFSPPLHAPCALLYARFSDSSQHTGNLLLQLIIVDRFHTVLGGP